MSQLEPLAIPTARATIHRHPERASSEDLAMILRQGQVAHLSFAVDAQPYVIPMSYVADPANHDLLYVHGSLASRLLRHLASGAPVCIAITLVTGLVYSKSAFNTSMNYHSAVGFGQAHVVAEPEAKTAVFEQMMHHYLPHRQAGRDYSLATAEQLAATELLAIAIEEWSVKARTGGPKGPGDDDATLPGTAGVMAQP